MDDWDKIKLAQFIKDNGLMKTSEAEEWIQDLEYFLENRKLRRDDKWQS